MGTWRKWIGSGPEIERVAVPWSRWEQRCFVLFLVGLLASLALFVHPWFQGSADASMYIIAARSMLRGEGYSLLEIPMLVRPPGMSVLILPVLWAAGTNFLILNIFTSLVGVVSIVLLYLFLRTRLHWSLAMLVGIAIWLNPAFRTWCNEVMSDVPSLAFLFGCLLLERRCSRRVSMRGELCLGVLIAMAAYIRAVNSLLIPAIALSRIASHWLSREPNRPAWSALLGKRVLVFSITAGALISVWSFRNDRVAYEPPSDLMVHYSASTRMWHVDRRDPNSARIPLSEIIGRLPTQSWSIANALGHRMHPPDYPAWKRVEPELPLPLAALFLGCLLALLIKRRAPAEIFLVGVLAVLGIYWGFLDRYILPVYALALPAVIEVIHDLLRPALGRSAARIIPAGVLLGFAILDWPPRRGWDELELSHRKQARFAQLVIPELGEGTRVIAQGGWEKMAYWDHPVYNMAFVAAHKLKLKRQRQELPMEALDALIEKYSIDIVLLNHGSILLDELKRRHPKYEKVKDVYLFRLRGRGPIRSQTRLQTLTGE